MFSGGVVVEPIAEAEIKDERERAWMALLAELRSVWKRRSALEAREIELLLEAEETRLYRWLGYNNIYAFIVAELGYSHHVATERMRVGHELRELHGLRETFHAGELQWSSVRELTRVVTPQTEQVWIEAIDGLRVEDVQQMVRGKSKGALPTDPVDPRKIKHRIVLEDVTEEALMLFKQARVAIANGQEGACSDDLVVRAFAKAVLEPAPTGDRPTGPRFMTAVTTCSTCKASAIVGAGAEVAITAEHAARVACDHVHVGDLQTSELTKPVGSIPAALRRKVWIRDRARCVVPGCKACRYLEVHHVVARENGGTNTIGNLALLCDAHHAQVHDGIITLRGVAPDLVFGMPLSPSWDWEADQRPTSTEIETTLGERPPASN